MTKIWDRLYLGSLKNAQQLATVNPPEITSVVSLCEEEVRRAANISYVHLPIADSRPIGAPSFDDIMNAIAKNVRRGGRAVRRLWSLRGCIVVVMRGLTGR